MKNTSLYDCTPELIITDEISFVLAQNEGPDFNKAKTTHGTYGGWYIERSSKLAQHVALCNPFSCENHPISRLFYSSL